MRPIRSPGHAAAGRVQKVAATSRRRSSAVMLSGSRVETMARLPTTAAYVSALWLPMPSISAAFIGYYGMPLLTNRCRQLGGLNGWPVVRCWMTLLLLPRTIVPRACLPKGCR